MVGLFSTGYGSLPLYATAFSVTGVTMCTAWVFSSDMTQYGALRQKPWLQTQLRWRSGWSQTQPA